MKYIVLLGRALYAMLFIFAGFGHFCQPSIAFAASQGLPMASFMVPLSGVMCLLGGFSILLGYRAKAGAWLIVLFLVPATFMFHKFWGLKDPMAMAMQQAMFMKNMGLIGAALLITHFGPGPMSLNQK